MSNSREDSGVGSGESSCESISMSVGSPARPAASLQDETNFQDDISIDLRLSPDEKRSQNDSQLLHLSSSLFAFQGGAGSSSAQDGIIDGPSSPNLGRGGTIQLGTGHILAENLDSQSSSSSLDQPSSSSPYQQRIYTGKMRSGILSQRRLQQRRKRPGSYPTAQEILGERKLRHASNSNYYETVQQLLEDGIDPCSSDNQKRSALHFAACKGYTDIAQILLNQGADPNQKDIIGNTPLHLAACTGDIGMVTILLKGGTDVTASDNSGRTPIHLAQAKLKMLQSNNNYTSSQLKGEVLQVVEMMHVFLKRSGKDAEVDFLNLFSSRLHHHQTKEEVDADVKDLLFSLTHLSLQ